MNYRIDRGNIFVSLSRRYEFYNGTEVSTLCSELFNPYDYVIVKDAGSYEIDSVGIVLAKRPNDYIIKTLRRDIAVQPNNILKVVKFSSTAIAKIVELFNSESTQSRPSEHKAFWYFCLRQIVDNSDELSVSECPNCHAVFQSLIVAPDTSVYCERCYHEHFSECRTCGNTCHTSELRDGECPTCARKLRVLPYHRNIPRLKFYSSGNESDDNKLYLGVELEVAYGGESDSTVGRILPIINTEQDIFMYCSHDSSIEDGFEMITQPATLEYHKSLYEKYKEIFKTLREMGYSSHDTSCCGLHIHFNRNYIEGVENSTLYNLFYLFQKYWCEIITFSRRNEMKLRYCRQMDSSDIMEYIESANGMRDHVDHYYALNISNVSTVEFRIFRGTLNIETFFATLEFVSAFINIAKSHNMTTIKDVKFNDILNTARQIRYWNRITSFDKEQ